MTADKVIAAAARYIGVKESPPNSNKVLFNTAYYGREVSGSAYPWCCAFLWFVFREAGASELFYGGGKTASCTTLMGYHRKLGQFVKSGYRRGDLALFNWDGGTSVAQHIGIIESVNGDGTINTIEGNTAVGNDSNGGCVMRRKRSPAYVIGAVRPAYTEESEEEEMTGEEIYKALYEYLRTQECPEWAKGEFQEAIDMGITDGTRPMELIPRYQAAIMAKRAAQK